MALLRLDEVSAGYRGLTVLRNVSLEVDAGEVVALLGPNGAGKTTLLRAITGMIPATGNRYFAGVRINRMPTHRIARLGLVHVPEGRGTLGELTVAENLALAARRHRGRRRAAPQGHSFAWLSERSGQRAGTLSGGEQQLLALARATAGQPRLLLLDEPSLGLAPAAVKQVYAHIAELARTRHLAILMVEQNAAVALRLARRAYVMESGRLAQHAAATDFDAELIRKSYLG